MNPIAIKATLNCYFAISFSIVNIKTLQRFWIRYQPLLKAKEDFGANGANTVRAQPLADLDSR